jgi:uncharacterized OB-fold protein
MSWKHFGFVSYTSDTKVLRFIRGLKEGKLLATKCRRCGTLWFPPRLDCSKCMNVDDMEWVEISGRCRLVTYTLCHFGPTGFEHLVPYKLGIVELDEGPKVLAIFDKEVKDEEIKIGRRFRLAPVELPGGKYVFMIKKP